MTDVEQKRRDEQRRVIIRNLFSSDEELRADARQELKDAWVTEQPAFNDMELSTQPAHNACLMAAKRDGNREVVEWILKL